MKWCLPLLLALPLAAADGPTIFYSWSFPGSTPAYAEITLSRDGSAVYRESVDDPDDQPHEFRLRPDEVDRIFALADQLDHFARPLETRHKVAFMGEKTFRWQGDGETHEQKFNHSDHAAARELAERFAYLTESIGHYFQLERTVSFDKLGVNEVLLDIQLSIEKGRLAAPDMFLPLLDRVIKNTSYLEMARTRAAAIAAHIRTTPAANGQ